MKSIISGLILVALMAGCTTNKAYNESVQAYLRQDRMAETFSMSGISKIEGDNITLTSSMPLDPLGLPKTDLEVFMDAVKSVAPFAAMWGVVASQPSAPAPTIVEQPAPLIVNPVIVQ